MKYTIKQRIDKMDLGTGEKWYEVFEIHRSSVWGGWRYYETWARHEDAIARCLHLIGQDRPKSWFEVFAQRAAALAGELSRQAASRLRRIRET